MRHPGPLGTRGPNTGEGISGAVRLDSVVLRESDTAMTCANMRFWAEIVKDADSVHKFVKLPCRSWSCPDCAKDNAQRLRRMVKAGLEAWFADHGITEAKLGYQVKLFTLTLPGREWRDARTLQEIEKIAKRNLNRLLQMLRKHRGLDTYVWVREVKGAKHLHFHMLLIGPGIASRDILDFVRGLWTVRYGMGNVDVQLVRSLHGAVHYVTKYLSKDVGAGRVGRRPVRDGEIDGDPKDQGDVPLGTASAPEVPQGPMGSEPWASDPRLSVPTRIISGMHYGMSAGLRSAVKVERDKKSSAWTVLKLGRLNMDGSIGSVVWEAGSLIPEEEEWVKEVLTLRDELLSELEVYKATQLLLWEENNE